MNSTIDQHEVSPEEQFDAVKLDVEQRRRHLDSLRADINRQDHKLFGEFRAAFVASGGEVHFSDSTTWECKVDEHGIEPCDPLDRAIPSANRSPAERRRDISTGLSLLIGRRRKGKLVWVGAYSLPTGVVGLQVMFCPFCGTRIDGIASKETKYGERWAADRRPFVVSEPHAIVPGAAPA